MKNNKPKVGDVVFRFVNDEPIELLVSKVGRKYFYCQSLKVSLENWRVEGWYFNGNRQIYNSVQAYRDEREAYRIYLKIRSKVDDFHYYPLDKLKTIEKIMDEEEK